jgi:hypothetical protein
MSDAYEVDPSSTDPFKGFEIKRTLVQYDFPLLQVAQSPKDELWLINWCETTSRPSTDDGPESAGIDTWLLFPVSESQLTDLTSDAISLRDLLLDQTGLMYLVEGRLPLKPERVRLVRTSEIPIRYFPRRNLSIHGKRPEIGGSLTISPRILRLDFHLTVKELTQGRVPFSLSGPFQDHFQRWVSASAHFIDDPKPKAVELAYPVSDWATINGVVTGIGSFRIVAECTDDTEKGSRMLEALSIGKLLTDSEVTPSTVRELVSRIGRDGILNLVTLLNLVMLQKLSVTISWSRGDLEDFFHLDPEQANSLSRKLRGPVAAFESKSSLLVQLSEDEAQKVRLPVNGQGGLQSLLRKLQKQLDSENNLTVTADQIEQIVRYSQNYGSGGFQGRLQGVLKEIKRLGIALSAVG